MTDTDYRKLVHETYGEVKLYSVFDLMRAVAAELDAQGIPYDDYEISGDNSEEGIV